MRWGVIVFPGTNCDFDVHHVLTGVCGYRAEYVWHEEADLSGYDAVVLPGGFSYGDYLRVGAVARFAPVMSSVAEFAAGGKPVLGICNGFQILCEAGLLPGALQRNRSLKFQCEPVFLRVENTGTPFTGACRPGQVLRVPINHGEGSYYADPATLADLEANNQIVFRYCSGEGTRDPRFNPNGSVADIAGVCNRAGNVVGLMPHPERAAEAMLGSADGRLMFELPAMAQLPAL